ncbi:diguanylate cyclase [Luteimonas saliphila]|uniref:diguanylate cyclase n=1 Tax=Luteimonas saliphila TaxID=2804919 RepID=UPI00192DF33F
MQAGKIHWVATLNRRYRSLFFALAFVVLATHLAYLQAGPVMWTLLVLQLLAYPQLAYWRAARAHDSLRAEMQNLLIDGVLLGAWIAVWGMPLWISFVLFVGVCVNVVIFMGMPGLWKGMAAVGSGMAAVALVQGLSFRPHTELHTSLLCIALLTSYLLFFANDAYRRGVSLRESRRQLGEQLAEITKLQTQLQEQAQRDPLTGLHNRRFLDEALERELAACNAAGMPLTLVLIDIDHFKRINDTYGHPAGDEMIRRLADLLRERVRDDGLIACRYGGEEFLLMLPGTALAEAEALAEDLRATFESMRVEVDERSMRTTLSIGVAGFPEHGTRVQKLVLRADHALYAAKLRGRNQVVLSSDEVASGRALPAAAH